MEALPSEVIPLLFLLLTLKDPCLDQVQNLIRSGKLQPAGNIHDVVRLDSYFTKLLRSVDSAKEHQEWMAIMNAWTLLRSGQSLPEEN